MMISFVKWKKTFHTHTGSPLIKSWINFEHPNFLESLVQFFSYTQTW